MKVEHDKMTKDSQELFRENRDMKDQLRVLNENLRRETELLQSKDRENSTLNSENTMLKQRLEEMRSDSGLVKDEQARLIENLRLQLNETRDTLNQVREDRQKEFKKLKERYEDQRRRESDKNTFDLEKLRAEIALAQKRLGQEEHFSKELAIINNKLQSNVSSGRASKKVPSATFYHQESESDEQEEEEELVMRKKAWAELEREQDEVKRNIKSILKTQPESLLQGSGERVKVPPIKYESQEKVDKKKVHLKEEMKKEERPASSKSNT